MRQLYIKQKVFSLSEKFTVKDQEENDVYYVEGSFMQLPKTYTVTNTAREEVAHITKKTFSLLPKFFVEVGGREVLTIKKEFTFFKSRYTIDATGIEVIGDWWDMDFEVQKVGEVVGKVRKKWFSWGDSYELEIWQEEMEALLVALVIAIDCAEADEDSSFVATLGN